jgi:hypothetical protein
MLQNFDPGDFLIFQLESAYGLLRVLSIDVNDDGTVWHVAAYEDFFQDVEGADKVLENPKQLKIGIPHIALTDRAFESTQVAKMKNVKLEANELAPYEEWKNSDEREITDRSIRLMLGLR